MGAYFIEGERPAQIQEITAGIQTSLNTGFRGAAQVEFVVMIENESLHSLQRRRGCGVSGILFLNRLSASIVAIRAPILCESAALLREAAGRTVSDPAEIDEEIHALCDALVASEGRLGP